MENLAGRAKLPNALRNYLSCTYTCSHGVAPGQLDVVVADTGDGPLDLTEIGDVELTDGQRSITAKNCRVLKVSRTTAGDGRGWLVSLADRRWAWQMGAISGEYNVRDATGRIIPVTRSPAGPPLGRP